jgi:hypothetical protein
LGLHRGGQSPGSVHADNDAFENEVLSENEPLSHWGATAAGRSPGSVIADNDAFENEVISGKDPLIPLGRHSGGAKPRERHRLPYISYSEELLPGNRWKNDPRIPDISSSNQEREVPVSAAGVGTPFTVLFAVSFPAGVTVDAVVFGMVAFVPVIFGFVALVPVPPGFTLAAVVSGLVTFA